MQAKEFLSRHGVVYRARDIENDPAAARELAQMGFRSVPVVVLPGRPPIVGFNDRELGAAIDVAVSAIRERPEAVFESFDRVLAATLAAAAQLDSAALNLRMPDRDRNLRELIYDVFCKALTWSQDDGPGASDPQDVRPPRPSDEDQKKAAARYPDASALVQYGEASRVVLRNRLSPDHVVDYDRILVTPDGPMTLGDTMTWIANHSAFHLRQLYWLMEHDLGIGPREPLDLARLPGIVLPADLW